MQITAHTNGYIALLKKKIKKIKLKKKTNAYIPAFTPRQWTTPAQRATTNCPAGIQYYIKYSSAGLGGGDGSGRIMLLLLYVYINTSRQPRVYLTGIYIIIIIISLPTMFDDRRVRGVHDF